MKINFKIIEHNNVNGTITVKVCRKHSIRSIDSYPPSIIETRNLDFGDWDSFVASLGAYAAREARVHEENEDVLQDNLPSNPSDTHKHRVVSNNDFSGLLNKVIGFDEKVLTQTNHPIYEVEL
tara:strand:+ start:386 stop:754 length:369 start_codon:yes stop_codon:yes gene_type:complete